MKMEEFSTLRRRGVGAVCGRSNKDYTGRPAEQEEGFSAKDVRSW